MVDGFADMDGRLGHSYLRRFSAADRHNHGRGWRDLLDEARRLEDECDHLSDFSHAPWIVAAYISIVPYRAWEPVMMWLDRKLCSTWH